MNQIHRPGIFDVPDGKRAAHISAIPACCSTLLETYAAEFQRDGTWSSVFKQAFRADILMIPGLLQDPPLHEVLGQIILLSTAQTAAAFA